MQVSMEEQGNVITITMNGSFTFNDNPQIRDILKDIKGKSAARIIFDVSGLDSVDSAGLGMMLLLRDTAQPSGASLEIRNPQGQIRKMFELSNFGELFNITDA